MNEIILKMTNINKTFSGVCALKNVDFELRSGEVHALMGENGAGKSTLMKILTGIYKADSGEIFVLNKKCDFHSVKDSQNVGIAIIHQELNLIPDLTVAGNIFLGREFLTSSIFINDKKMNEEASKILKYVGANINPCEKLTTIASIDMAIARRNISKLFIYIYSLFANFSLTLASTSANISGFCSKNSFALSLPCPILSSL